MKFCWLVMLILLASCASADEGYQASWAPLRDDAACSAVFGTYENIGELSNVGVAKNYKSDGYRPELSSLLLHTINERIAAHGGEVVEISQRDSGLYVRMLRGLEVLGSVQYPITQCSAGWLTILAESGMAHGNGNVVLGYTSDTTMLHAAVDGSLVVKHVGKGAGLAYLALPVVGSTTTYMRFKKHQ